MNYKLTWYKSLLRMMKDGVRFTVSTNFWEKRYLKNGNSGEGSYGRLAEYKAETLNEFVCRHKVKNVLEFVS